MAFAQKLGSASLRKFTDILDRAHGVAALPAFQTQRPHLVVVGAGNANGSDEPQPRQSHNSGLLFSIPKHARARAADLQRRQQAVLAHINTSLPEQDHLLAGSILPAEAFQSDLGRFLMLACDLFACSMENTFIAPASAEISKRLGLPFIPLTSVEHLRSSAISKLQWLREAVVIDHRRTSAALQQGDISQLLQTKDRQTAYRHELHAIIRQFAIARCGTDAWDTHEAYFRPTLQIA